MAALLRLSSYPGTHQFQWAVDTPRRLDNTSWIKSRSRPFLGHRHLSRSSIKLSQNQAARLFSGSTGIVRQRSRKHVSACYSSDGRRQSRGPKIVQVVRNTKSILLQILAAVILVVALLFTRQKAVAAPDQGGPPPAGTSVSVDQGVEGSRATPDSSSIKSDGSKGSNPTAEAGQKVAKLDHLEAGKGDGRLVVPRENLDTYYLPEQVPQPSGESFISDQLEEPLRPPLAAAQTEAVIATLRRTTKTEIRVVALKSLAEAAGVPETFARSLYSHWGVGGEKGDGALVLYVKEGGRSWHRDMHGRVETDVDYQGGVTVVLGSALETELGGDAARAGVAGLKKETWDPLCKEGKPGDAVLDAVAAVAERTWDARGMNVPKEVTETVNDSTFLKIVKPLGLLILAWFGLSKVDPEGKLGHEWDLAWHYFWWRFDRVFNARGPRCLVCNKGMRPVREALPEDLEDPGMVSERRMKSADYWLYQCQEKNCSGPPEDRSIVLLMRRPFAAPVCPQCGFHTLHLVRKVKKRAGVRADGVVEKAEDCKHCGHKHREELPLNSWLHSLWPVKRKERVMEDGEAGVAVIEGASEGL